MTEEVELEDVTTDAEDIPADDGGEKERFAITIEGEDEEESPDQEQEPETPVIRTLRQKLREAEKKAKALEREKSEARAGKKSAELPARPKLEDFDFDDGKFADALEQWVDQKKAHDAKARADQEDRDAINREFEERKNGYAARKATLGADDFDDAEAAVDEAFTVEQRGMLIDAAERPEHVVYALGTKPKLAAELAKIKNPVRFIAEIVRLEGRLTVSSTKKAPPPERRVTQNSGGAISGASKQLEKLREDGRRSGDMTAYLAAKRASQAK